MVDYFARPNREIGRQVIFQEILDECFAGYAQVKGMSTDGWNGRLVKEQILAVVEMGYEHN